jgi:hypothetical protein
MIERLVDADGNERFKGLKAASDSITSSAESLLMSERNRLGGDVKLQHDSVYESNKRTIVEVETQLNSTINNFSKIIEKLEHFDSQVAKSKAGTELVTSERQRLLDNVNQVLGDGVVTSGEVQAISKLVDAQLKHFTDAARADERYENAHNAVLNSLHKNKKSDE